MTNDEESIRHGASWAEGGAFTSSWEMPACAAAGRAQPCHPERESHNRLLGTRPRARGINDETLRRPARRRGGLAVGNRRNEGTTNVGVVRIEELYPFPIEEYARVIGRYRNAKEIVWCQEEPQNQGAWYQIRHRLQEPLGPSHELFYAGRPGAAAPASGIHALHVRQQQALVAAALTSSSKERTAAGLSSVGKRA